MKAHRLIPLILFLLLLIGLSRTGVSPTQAALPTLGLLAPSTPQPSSGTVEVQVVITDSANLAAFEFDLVYDRTLVQVVSFTLGSFLGQVIGCNPSSARCAVALGPLDQSSGTTSLGAYSYGAGGGANGNGVLATIRFKPLANRATVTLRLANALLSDVAGAPATPATQDASFVLVQGSQLYLPLVVR